jgi:hypothetical protein
MPNEYLVEMTCSRFPYYRDVVHDRPAAEATARLQARKWERESAGEGPLEVQVRISRRQVTPWVADGDTYEFSTIDLHAVDLHRTSAQHSEG